MAVLQAKAPNPQTLRKITLEGHRFSPAEALSLGLVDRIAPGGTEELLAAAAEMAKEVGALAKTGAWGVNKVSSEHWQRAHTCGASSLQCAPLIAQCR